MKEDNFQVHWLHRDGRKMVSNLPLRFLPIESDHEEFLSIIKSIMKQCLGFYFKKLVAVTF